MFDLIENGAAWLGETLANFASGKNDDPEKARTIRIYTGTEWVTINATPGRRDFEVIENHDQITRLQTRDYLVNTAELVTAAGDPFLPTREMMIEETLGPKTWTYQVIAPNGEDAYSFSDHHRTRLRIHSEKRSESQA